MTNTQNTAPAPTTAPAPAPVITVAVNPHGQALAVRKGDRTGGTGTGYAVAYAVANARPGSRQAKGGVAIMYPTYDRAADHVRLIDATGKNDGVPVVPGSAVVLPTVTVPAGTDTGGKSDLLAIGNYLYAAWCDVADGHAADRDRVAAAAAKAAKAKATRAANAKAKA